MKYFEALKQLGKDFDPFVHINTNEIIDESEKFFVIPARAPYVPDHLLIIPKRKVYTLKSLTHKERDEMYGLVEKWTKKLHTKHNDVNLLLRDGLVGGLTEKSVNHLHFHLIPDCAISTDVLLEGDNREFLSDNDFATIIETIKITYL